MDRVCVCVCLGEEDEIMGFVLQVGGGGLSPQRKHKETETVR